MTILSKTPLQDPGRVFPAYVTKAKANTGYSNFTLSQIDGSIWSMIKWTVFGFNHKGGWFGTRAVHGSSSTVDLGEKREPELWHPPNPCQGTLWQRNETGHSGEMVVGFFIRGFKGAHA